MSKDQAERFVFLLSSLIDAKIDKDDPFNIQMIETSMVDTILLTGTKNNSPTAIAAKIESDSKPEVLLCPECDSAMKVRNGAYGQFWGCTQYPSCSGTRDMDGLSKAERKDKPKERKPGRWNVR